MKTRNGFISNSSSSSFVVLFPHTPLSPRDLKEMMFEKYDASEVITGEIKDCGFMTVEQITDRVYQDICKGQKDRLSNLEEALRGYIEEIDRNYTIVSLVRDSSEKIRDEEYKLYHEFGHKYGYEPKDRAKWKKTINIPST
jgi:hypothetical protein